MIELEYAEQDHIAIVSLNRASKGNSFDDKLLALLDSAIDKASNDDNIRVLILEGKGKHFSAGADLAWMKRMAGASELENLEDTILLGKVMQKLYLCPKPTIALVQGAAFGGGAGLVAACDFAFAQQNAVFSFSEVQLGLIPSVISPYVIRALGERRTKALFLTAERFDANKALDYGLIDEITENDLLEEGLKLAEKLSAYPKEALRAAKALVLDVADKPIDDALLRHTASLIAERRRSEEAQIALQAFLGD